MPVHRMLATKDEAKEDALEFARREFSQPFMGKASAFNDREVLSAKWVTERGESILVVEYQQRIKGEAVNHDLP